MTLDYISDRIDRGQFLEKVYNASQSQSSKESAHTHLTNLDLYCKDKYGRDTETILDDLRTDMENTRSPSKVLRFLSIFFRIIPIYCSFIFTNIFRMCMSPFSLIFCSWICHGVGSVEPKALRIKVLFFESKKNS